MVFRPMPGSWIGWQCALSVSWAGAEYLYPFLVLSAHDWLRYDQTLHTVQIRPKQTYLRLIYAVLPLSPIHDPYKTRFRFCPLGQWEYSGEATHTGSLKVSLGHWQGRRPLNIRGASFRKSAPSIHQSTHLVVRSILLRTIQTILPRMRSFLPVLLMTCSICFAESAINSADNEPPQEYEKLVPGQSFAREQHALL